MMSTFFLRRLTEVDEQASSVLETALVLPVLVLLLCVAVDLGRACTIAIATASAAHAGALYGASNPTDTAGMIAAASLDAKDWTLVTPVATYGCQCSDGTNAIVACTSAPSCSFNSVYYVQVTTTSIFTPMLPYPGLSSGFTMSGKARLRASR
jgi:Flp pilus assembly protein TadG